MINNLLEILSNDNIYLIVNWGVLPFWILLILSPNHGFTNFIVQSIVAPIIFASAYVLIAYNIYLDGAIFDSFELYSGLDGLYSLFSNESFLLINLQSRTICFALAGTKAGALIPCKLCNPPNKIGLYRILIEFFFSILLISL